MLLIVLLSQTTLTAALSLKGSCEQHGLFCSCPEACARDQSQWSNGAPVDSLHRHEGESCHSSSAPGASEAAADPSSCRLLAGCGSNDLPGLYPDHVPLVLSAGAWLETAKPPPSRLLPGDAAGTLHSSAPPAPPPKSGAA